MLSVYAIGDKPSWWLFYKSPPNFVLLGNSLPPRKMSHFFSIAGQIQIQMRNKKGEELYLHTCSELMYIEETEKNNLISKKADQS